MATVAKAQEISVPLSELPTKQDTLNSQFTSNGFVMAGYIPSSSWRSRLDIRDELGLATVCSCINYAKYILGVTGEVWGYPDKLATTSMSPHEGGLVLTSEGPYGHIAVVTSVNEDSITISEANYESCKITTRTLKLNDPVIRGYR